MSDAPECPTCGRDDFAGRKGMRRHHNDAHGISLVGETKECAWCGETFTYRPDKAPNRERKYCSRECCGNAFSSERDQKVTISCRNCGTEKRIKPSKVRDDGNFCTPECFTEWHRGENNHFYGNVGYYTGITGEDHPMWKGGREEYYGASWFVQRERAIKRDFEQCRLCRRSRDDHRTEFGKDFDVHHRTPFAAAVDDPKTSHRLENLITLCDPCHRHLEASWNHE